MSTEKFKRAQNLRDFVRNEIDGFKTGEITSISSNEELRARFCYRNVSCFYDALHKENLITERKMLIMEHGRQRLTPSRNLAWLLGIIAGGGSCTNRFNGQISFFSTSEALLTDYRTSIEGVFKINTKPSFRRLEDSRYVSIDDLSIRRSLGDLRKAKWSNTLQSRHDWVFNKNYLWGFLEGFSDTRGHPMSNEKFYFSTYSATEANFLAEILVRAGLENPKIFPPNQKRTNMQRVEIYNQDLNILATNIQSRIPENEKILAEIRNKSIKPPEVHIETAQRLINKATGEKTRVARLLDFVKEEIEKYNTGEITEILSTKELRAQFGYKQANTVIKQLKLGGLFEARKSLRKQFHTTKSHAIFSNEELIEEWFRIRGVLGHTPSSNDIQRLRNEDGTKINIGAYIYRFGHYGKSRSFTKAQEYLEQMVVLNI